MSSNRGQAGGGTSRPWSTQGAARQMQYDNRRQQGNSSNNSNNNSSSGSNRSPGTYGSNKADAAGRPRPLGSDNSPSPGQRGWGSGFVNKTRDNSVRSSPGASAVPKAPPPTQTASQQHTPSEQRALHSLGAPAARKLVGTGGSSQSHLVILPPADVVVPAAAPANGSVSGQSTEASQHATQSEDTITATTTQSPVQPSSLADPAGSQATAPSSLPVFGSFGIEQEPSGTKAPDPHAATQPIQQPQPTLPAVAAPCPTQPPVLLFGSPDIPGGPESSEGASQQGPVHIDTSGVSTSELGSKPANAGPSLEAASASAEPAAGPAASQGEEEQPPLSPHADADAPAEPARASSASTLVKPAAPSSPWGASKTFASIVSSSATADSQHHSGSSHRQAQRAPSSKPVHTGTSQQHTGQAQQRQQQRAAAADPRQQQPGKPRSQQQQQQQQHVQHVGAKSPGSSEARGAHPASPTPAPGPAAPPAQVLPLPTAVAAPVKGQWAAIAAQNADKRVVVRQISTGSSTGGAPHGGSALTSPRAGDASGLQTRPLAGGVETPVLKLQPSPAASRQQQHSVPASVTAASSHQPASPVPAVVPQAELEPAAVSSDSSAAAAPGPSEQQSTSAPSVPQAPAVQQPGQQEAVQSDAPSESAAAATSTGGGGGEAPAQGDLPETATSADSTAASDGSTQEAPVADSSASAPAPSQQEAPAAAAPAGSADDAAAISPPAAAATAEAAASEHESSTGATATAATTAPTPAPAAAPAPAPAARAPLSWASRVASSSASSSKPAAQKQPAAAQRGQQQRGSSQQPAPEAPGVAHQAPVLPPAPAAPTAADATPAKSGEYHSAPAKEQPPAASPTPADASQPPEAQQLPETADKGDGKEPATPAAAAGAESKLEAKEAKGAVKEAQQEEEFVEVRTKASRRKEVEEARARQQQQQQRQQRNTGQRQRVPGDQQQRAGAAAAQPGKPGGHAGSLPSSPAPVGQQQHARSGRSTGSSSQGGAAFMTPTATSAAVSCVTSPVPAAAPAAAEGASPEVIVTSDFAMQVAEPPVAEAGAVATTEQAASQPGGQASPVDVAVQQEGPAPAEPVAPAAAPAAAAAAALAPAAAPEAAGEDADEDSGAATATALNNAFAALSVVADELPAAAAPAAASQPAAAAAAAAAAVSLEELWSMAASAGGASGAAAPRFAPRGLVNTGNSCFINATLQALLACPSFCGVLQRLRGVAGTLDPAASPTLWGLATLAAELEGPAAAAALGAGGSGIGSSGAAPAAGAKAAGSSGASVGAARTADDAAAGSGPAAAAASQAGWSEVGRAGRKARGKEAAGGAAAAGAAAGSAAASGPAAPAAASPAAAQLLLGGKPLVPSALNEVVRRFSPRQAAAAAAAAAAPNGKLSMAQVLALKGSSSSVSVVKTQEQEDAQEFLQFVVIHAHEEICALRKKHGSGDDQPAADGGDEDEEWAQVGKKNRAAVTRQVGGGDDSRATSPLSSIFHGALKSVVRAAGAKPSATIQPFWMLHLDIVPDAEGATSVDAALAAYTSPETLQDYKAEGASSAGPATKGVSLYRLPEVLVLHIKRFTYTMTGGTTKNHRAVRFDPVLRLRRPILSDDCPDCRGAAEYKLVATVSHHGRNAAGGHYTADVLQADGRTWLRFNDAVVEGVTGEAVAAEKPYLLFYQRLHTAGGAA